MVEWVHEVGILPLRRSYPARQIRLVAARAAKSEAAIDHEGEARAVSPSQRAEIDDQGKRVVCSQTSRPPVSRFRILTSRSGGTTASGSRSPLSCWWASTSAAYNGGQVGQVSRCASTRLAVG